ncbi:MAG TPA: nicotinate phosphoribosyltransferase, partial [Burkholderiales bacterium]|nr:nicotinate phosphoribosyltransferase [Burkholderiales bacterium]
MLQAYFDEGMRDTAVFEFFVRALPTGRNFLLAAGLEQVLSYLEQFRVTEPELAWLRAQGGFSEPFLAALGALRFTGDVHALPEGTVFFVDEPILRITAPIAQAQVIESRLLSLLHFSTLIASKAARSVLAAPGKLLVDFGMRR